MKQDNSEKRKAALAAVMQMGEGPIIPKAKTVVPPESVEQLEQTIQEGYLAQTVGELL